MHSNALHPNARHGSPSISSQTYWLAAALLFGAILLALAIAGSDAGRSLEFDDGDAWPTSAPSVPGANDFAPYNDGRPAPGEAVIGVNEVSWQQGAARPANCADGSCPVPAYYQPAPATSAPPPAAVYPAGYAPPATYYASSYSSSDCQCDDCQCAGRGRAPRFPIARRASGFVVRGAARIVTAPFRWRRNARANW